MQILGLASGCAAVDGVLAEVSQLLQGGIRGAQPPAVQASLEHAAVRCVGLAGQAPGDTSAHTCGLSTAATACMLEMARTSGTGVHSWKTTFFFLRCTERILIDAKS